MGRSLVPATPRSPWSLHSTCRSAHKGKTKSVHETVCFTHPGLFLTKGILFTYPVWDEVVQTQAIGVRVILPSVPVVVDLREFKCYTHKDIFKLLNIKDILL